MQYKLPFIRLRVKPCNLRDFSGRLKVICVDKSMNGAGIFKPRRSHAVSSPEMTSCSAYKLVCDTQCGRESSAPLVWDLSLRERAKAEFISGVSRMNRLRLDCMLIFIATLFLGTTSDGILSIKLIHYENPQSMLPDGSCCDGFSPTGKCNSCEYIFHICISDTGAKPCSLCNFRTEHAPGETILFESEIMTKPFGDMISNPWQLSVTKWNGSVSFGVTTYDEDSLDANDLVSVMARNITINATRFGISEKTMLLLEGKKRNGITPLLTAEISVSCNKNYLIPSCNDHCVDTDDANGHYTCNYVKGIRECLPGWYGDRCRNKVVSCVPRNDSQGHYTCDKVTGEKICLPGWTNNTKNCTEAIIIKPTTSAFSSTIQLTKWVSAQVSIHPSQPSQMLRRTSLVSLETSQVLRHSSQVLRKISQTLGVTNSHSYSEQSKTSSIFRILQTSSASKEHHFTTSKEKNATVTTLMEMRYKTTPALSLEPSRGIRTTVSKKQSVVTSLGSARLTILPQTNYMHRSSAIQVAPTKEIPVTTTTTRTKGVDFSKIFGIGVSNLCLVGLLIVVLVLYIKQNRANRVQPISQSERYKQGSARFTASSRMSGSAASAPSIQGITETRIGPKPYVTEDQSQPIRGYNRTRFEPNDHVTMVYHGSANSEKITKGSTTRENSARSFHFQQGKAQANIGSTVSKQDSGQTLIPNHPFLLVPMTSKHKFSL